jgi:hypothetical protein
MQQLKMIVGNVTEKLEAVHEYFVEQSLFLL